LPTWLSGVLPHTVVQHPINPCRNHLVDDEKIQAEENDRNNHYRRRCLDLSPAGKSNFPHLIADVGKKILGARRELRQLIALVFARYRYCFRHWFLPSIAALSAGFQNLAGAEGFEPPSSVLETDSLAIELTPL
jgi:hypothetical protein